MTDEQFTQIIDDFLKEFKYTHLHGAEIRVTSAEVRDFMRANNISVSFRRFNELLDCKGRTTNNKYVYNVGFLLAEPAEEQQTFSWGFELEGESLLEYSLRVAPGIEAWHDKIEREINRWVTTLNWYGSKRSWMQEFVFFYGLVAQQGCNKMVDSFAGSGFLGLLAAKSGYFESVVLNEASFLVYNYHLVMKDLYAFKSFCEDLKIMGKVRKETYEVYYKDLYGLEGGKAGKEKRKQFKNLSVKKAEELYVVQHHAFQGQGSYTSKRKAPAFYIENLWRTHQLYNKIELKNLHYLKVLKASLNDEKSLIVLDPPYMQSTRVQKSSYGLEFTERQHRTMLQTLTKEPIKAKVLVCGYKSSLYDRYFTRADWHCVRLKKAGKKGEEGKEMLWFNFDISGNVAEYGEMFDWKY